MQARIGALLAFGLLLSGCVLSDVPLLQNAEPITPYPLQYDFVTLDAEGRLTFKDDGKMDEAIFLREENTYRDTVHAGTTVTLFPLKDHPGLAVLRLTQPSGNVYSLAEPALNRIEIRTVGDAGLQALQAETAKNTPGGEALKVTNDGQLLTAMNIIAAAPKKVVYNMLAVPYNAIAPSKEGLPESHVTEDPNDPEHGSPAVWYAKGMMAEGGIGSTPINLAVAAQDYRKAAEAGIAGAMTDLARLLDEGKGVEKDQAAAKDWYGKAVVLGNSDAMLALGRKFLVGDGVEKHAGWAGFYLRAAAASGNIDAMMMMADLLATDGGLGADRQEQLFWLVKAAEAGNRQAASQLAAAIRAGDGTPANAALAVKWEKAATPPFPVPPSALRGSEFTDFAPHERQVFMTGFLGMLWTLNDRLKAEGLEGNCAEGYAMDNAAGTRDGLSEEMESFAKQYPSGNLSADAAAYVYSHCDARRNILLLDFYMLTFGAMKAQYARDSDDTDIFMRGALSAAVQAHVQALKYKTAECIEEYFDNEDSDDELRHRAKGYDADIVTNVVMRELDVLCPP